MTKFFIAILYLTLSASTFGSSLAEAEKAQQEIEIAEQVSKRDYSAILKRAEIEASTRARFSDGMWRLSLLYSNFYQAVESQLSSDLDWDEAEAQTASLAQNNAQAWLLHAQVLSSRAWSIRGPSFAHQVSPEAFREFHRILRRARKVLDESKDALTSNPAWYSMRMTVAIELSEGDSLVEALFAEGVARHPGYHAIYFSKMRYLTPKWRGSTPRMLDFLDAVAKMGGQTLSEGMYARLVWFADGNGALLHQEPRLNSKAMIEHSDILLASYPDQWNAQKLFELACERSDKQHTLKIMSVVRDPPLPGLWNGDLSGYQMCRDWATGRIPGFVLQLNVEGELRNYTIE